MGVCSSIATCGAAELNFESEVSGQGSSSACHETRYDSELGFLGRLGQCMHKPTSEWEEVVPAVVDRKGLHAGLPVFESIGNPTGYTGRYTATRSLEMDYNVDRFGVLSTGMSGRVRQAVGRCDGCNYAVKTFVKPELSNRRLKALRNEMDVYLSLDHPHVARLEMAYETKDELHLVMECLEGGELFDHVNKTGKFSEEAAAETARQMLLAVVYLHSRGIVHRDLKLENFLYEKKDARHLKLIDFGLAVFAAPNEKITQFAGSLHYIAPEVYKGSYDSQCDMFSLGTIVYMLLLGCEPYRGSNSEVRRRSAKGKVHWPSRFSKLSAPAQDFVRSLLSVNPAVRPTARQALEHPWLRSHVQKETIVEVMDQGMLGRLRSFGRASQLQRNMLSLVAWSLSPDDRAQLRRALLAIDRDSSGTISLPEFKSAFESIGVSDSGRDTEALFARLDTDGSDSIEYSEFLAAAMPGAAYLQECALRRTFARFDRHGDGTLSRGELVSVLGESCAATDIDAWINEADNSGRGELSFDDFQTFLQRAKA